MLLQRGWVTSACTGVGLAGGRGTTGSWDGSPPRGGTEPSEGELAQRRVPALCFLGWVTRGRGTLTIHGAGAGSPETRAPGREHQLVLSQARQASSHLQGKDVGSHSPELRRDPAPVSLGKSGDQPHPEGAQRSPRVLEPPGREPSGASPSTHHHAGFGVCPAAFSPAPAPHPLAPTCHSHCSVRIREAWRPDLCCEVLRCSGPEGRRK